MFFSKFVRSIILQLDFLIMSKLFLFKTAGRRWLSKKIFFPRFPNSKINFSYIIGLNSNNKTASSCDLSFPGLNLKDF